MLTGCSEVYTAAGPWEDVPEGPPPVVAPPQDPQDPQQSPPPGGEEGGDPNVVASGLTVPTGIALLPDGSAIVGERTTGRIVQVFPDAAPPVELMTVAGLDASGDGGLLGLAVSPTFAQDGLIYAFMTTVEDNRVVKFTLGGTPNPVLVGIPKGATHNGGALMFGLDGLLYAGTGDAGQPTLAADPNSFAGKVLRFDIFGEPTGPAAVFTDGHSNVTGLCSDPAGTLFGTDVIDAAPDEINLLIEDESYGYPEDPAGSTDPLLTVDPPTDGLAGCAAAEGALLASSLDGRRLYGTELDADLVPTGDLIESLTDQYGRLRGMVLDAEGALWITTTNRDGIGVPVEDDDRVLRILSPPVGGGGGSPA